MQSTLYLFVNEPKTEFKIGITDKIEDRYLRLSSVWGSIDLTASCTVFGSRREVCGLEKTLHFLLGKWKVEKPSNLDGNSEWFLMDCFDKAIEIIKTASKLRDEKSNSDIFYGIDIPKVRERIFAFKPKIVKKNSSNLDKIKQHWGVYEQSTIGITDHPDREDAWLWVMDTSDVKVSLFETMIFRIPYVSISLVINTITHDHTPLVEHITISKLMLAELKNYDQLQPIHDFIYNGILNLINQNQ